MPISSSYPSIAPSLDLDFANSQVLDPRINFTRAGTGTYYDGETSALAEQNLLLRSEEFDNAYWSKYNASVTANSVAAPNGTTTADTITFSSTVGALFRSSVTGGIQYTASCYFSSAGTAPFPALVIGQNASPMVFAVYNLAGNTVSQTYTAGTGTSIASTSITSVGGNWYRCSITFTLGGTAANNLKLEFAPTATGNTVDANGEIVGNTAGQFYYAWGAQLEQNTGATPYQVTTTAAVTNYIPQLLTAPANTPRFDFNPTTRASLGLLMEQQSINLFTYSSQFDNAAWTKDNATLTADTNIAPDGTLSADTVTPTAGFGGVRQSISLTAGTVYSYSCYFKAASTNFGYLTFFSGANGAEAWFNLSNGTVGSTTNIGTGVATSSSITSVGNGWYRCVLVFTCGTTQSYSCFIRPTSANSTASAIGNSAFIWGAQLEATGYPTSYIPTVASSVTRAQDLATISGTNFSNWFNNQQGTVYCSFDVAAVSTTGIGMSPWEINNNSSTGYFLYKNPAGNLLVYLGAANQQIGTIASANSTQQATQTYNNISPTASSGILNGGSVGTIATPTALTYVPTQVSLGRTTSSGNPLTGHIRKFAYYPVASTTAQMQALTGS